MQDPMQDAEHIYSTWAEVETEVTTLKTVGWEVLPCDDPQRGLRGYLAFRFLDKATGAPIPKGETETHPVEEILEQCLNILWAPLGAPQELDRQRVSADELYGLFMADPDAYCCDDICAREMGFVWYRDGKARLRCSTLTSYKASVHRHELQAIRAKLYGRKLGE